MPAISKITAKGQTTVPQEVRAALGRGRTGLWQALSFSTSCGTLGRLAQKDQATTRKALRLLFP